MHSRIAGLSDPPGGIDEETAEELRYEDCISDNESYDSNHVMDIELTNVMLQSLYRDMPTMVFQIVTCIFDCSISFNSGLVSSSFGSGTSTIGVLSGLHSPIFNDSRSALR